MQKNIWCRERVTARNTEARWGCWSVSVEAFCKRKREVFFIPPPRIVSILFLQQFIKPKLPALLLFQLKLILSIVFKPYANVILAHLSRPSKFA